jgi:transcriptional regulator with XRE-family HTH domain
VLEPDTARIREALRESDLSSSEVARRAGVSASAVTRLVSGEVTAPRKRTLRAIGEALHIEPQTPPGARVVKALKSDGHRSVITTERVPAGAMILELAGVESPNASRDSVQVGLDAHLHPFEGRTHLSGEGEPVWPLLNHSCAPNACLRGRSLIALQDVSAGAEVTFDYNTTEWDMANPFPCWCGQATCVGLVRGYRWLDEDARRLRREAAAAHLLERESIPSPGTGLVVQQTVSSLFRGHPDDGSPEQPARRSG